MGVILARIAGLLRGSSTTDEEPAISVLAPKRILAVDDEPSVARAVEQSRGNPLFALQLLYAWAGGGYLTLDDFRMPGAQHFHDHAGGRRPYVGDLAKGPVGLQERLDWRLEVPNGGGGPLVTPTTMLGCLDRGEIAQQRRDGAVGIPRLDHRSSPHSWRGEQIRVQPRMASAPA